MSGVVVTNMSAFLLFPDLDLQRHRRLWVAVLQLAIDDVRGTGAGCTKSDRARHTSQARSWIYSGTCNVVGFNWICVTLDIDPDRARALILKEVTS